VGPRPPQIHDPGRYVCGVTDDSVQAEHSHPAPFYGTNMTFLGQNAGNGNGKRAVQDGCPTSMKVLQMVRKLTMDVWWATAASFRADDFGPCSKFQYVLQTRQTVLAETGYVNALGGHTATTDHIIDIWSTSSDLYMRTCVSFELATVAPSETMAVLNCAWSLCPAPLYYVLQLQRNPRPLED